jgi:hypothetical protein
MWAYPAILTTLSISAPTKPGLGTPNKPTILRADPPKATSPSLTIRDAVTKDLSAKSLTEVASNANPDVYVAYSVRIENQQQRVGGSPFGYGYPYGYGYGGYGGYGYPYGGSYNYKAGTVIIDIVDAKRKELAWRGTGQAQLDKNTITEEETYRIVNSVLGNYPPTDDRRRQAVR